MKKVAIFLCLLSWSVAAFCEPPAKLWNGFWVTDPVAEINIVHREIPELEIVDKRFEAIVDSVIAEEKKRWYYKPDLRFYISVHTDYVLRKNEAIEKELVGINAGDILEFHNEHVLIRQGHVFIVRDYKRPPLRGLFIEKASKIRIEFVDYQELRTGDTYDEWTFARKNGKLNFVGRTVFCPDPPPER